MSAKTPNEDSLGSYSLHLSPAQSVKRVREIIRLRHGDVLEGKYRILDEIGVGGMGVVYRAEHVSLNVQVAVKVLLPTVTDVHNVVDRFRIEARSAASIKHPNVVEVTDFGLTPDRRPFFVMEYLEGESLADRLAARSTLKQREIVEIIDQILSGLGAAHAQGVIHRDMKPENVFLAKTSGGKEVVKLLDFGIAKILGGPAADPRSAKPLQSGQYPELSLGPDGRPLTMQGMVLGTPGYMAPEVATGQAEADARSDLFSVGVLLYEAMAGRPPFPGEDVNKVMKNTISSPVIRMKDLNPGVSKEMERLVHTSLAKRPKDRFQNSEEFLRHLTAAAVGSLPPSPRRCATSLTTLAGATPQAAPRRSDPEADSVDTMDAPTIPDAPDPRDVAAAEKINAGRRSSRASVPEPERRRIPIVPIVVGILALAALAAVLIYTGREEPPLPPVEKKEVETVSVWLDLTPRKALVFVNGRRFNERPLILEKSDSPVEITVSMAGFENSVRRLFPSAEQSLKVVLEPSDRSEEDAGADAAPAP